MDLVAGRYPLYNTEWALDGQPNPPYRQSISRGDIATGNGGAALAAASGVMAVVPVVCHPGDIIGAIQLMVGTIAGTPTHSWVALYTGVTSSATLIGQSADVVGGMTLGVNKFTFSALPYLVGGFPGTPQGAGQAASGPSGGPVVLGVGIMNAQTTAPKLDGMLGSSGYVIGNQLPMIQTVGSGLTTTAPATLAGIATSTGVVPYVALTRS